MILSSWAYERFWTFEKELPSKEMFYSSLMDENIGDKDYEHVLKVWNTYEMKTMKDYHDSYLKLQFLLLADVFEKFRNSSLKNHVLCPNHYLRAPALSWDTMLSVAKLSSNLFQMLTYICSLKKVALPTFPKAIVKQTISI